jgi:hypothetical protein
VVLRVKFTKFKWVGSKRIDSHEPDNERQNRHLRSTRALAGGMKGNVKVLFRITHSKENDEYQSLILTKSELVYGG